MRGDSLNRRTTTFPVRETVRKEGEGVLEMFKMVTTGAWAACFLLMLCPHALAQGNTPMMLHSAWSAPDTRYLRQNINEFKNLPFSGTEVTISYPQNPAGNVLGGSSDQDNLSWQVFQSNPVRPMITDAMVSGAISDLSATNFSGVSDNFLKVVVYPKDSGWDWFDDTGWNKVLNNIGQMPRVAYAGGLRGIFLDGEEYGVPMWSWGGTRPDYRLQDLSEYAGRTWQETRAKVYNRGISFGQAMSAEFPGINVWMTYGYSHIVHEIPEFTSDLSDTNNGLLAAFLDGMIRGTDDDAVFIDGGEPAYRYRTRSEFADLRSTVKNTAELYTIEPVRYLQKIRVGFGLYMDQYRYPGSLPWDSANPQNNYMTPELLEEVLGYALDESDGYLWLYSEIPSWWLDNAGDTFGEGVLSRTDHGWIDPVYWQAVENAIPLPVPEPTAAAWVLPVMVWMFASRAGTRNIQRIR